MSKPPLVSDNWSARARTNSVFVIIAMCVVTLIMWIKATTAIAAKRWPATDGVIVSAAVVHAGRGGVRPEIVFQYQVGGIGYSSDRHTLGVMSYGGHSGSEATVASFPPGKAVRVYYDPRDPAQATLQREGAVAPNVSFGLMTGTLGIVVGYLRFMRREPETATGRWARLRASSVAGTRR